MTINMYCNCLCDEKKNGWSFSTSLHNHSSNFGFFAISWIKMSKTSINHHKFIDSYQLDAESRKSLVRFRRPSPSPSEALKCSYFHQPRIAFWKKKNKQEMLRTIVNIKWEMPRDFILFNTQQTTSTNHIIFWMSQHGTISQQSER